LQVLTGCEDEGFRSWVESILPDTGSITFSNIAVQDPSGTVSFHFRCVTLPARPH
jgi:hypothetical protein